MLRRKKFKLRVLTFTILSNDANKVVTRLRVPRIGIIFMFLLALVPIFLLAYFIETSMDQQAKNEQLVTKLELKTNKAEVLQAQVDQMEEEKVQVEQKIEKLNEMESELQEYITALPEEASGGIDIPIDKADINTNSDGTALSILDSTNWLTSYKETLANIDEVNHKLQYLPTKWPTDPETISSHFGIRNDPFNATPSVHTGTDFGAPTGTPVYAGADGTVTKAERYGGYGKTIIVHHSGTYKTLYAHLSEMKVSYGDSVKKGEIIGLIGNTGRSTGPHLHYEIIKNGEPIDAEEYLNNFNDTNN
ncbi:hypothetical protein GCM10011351_12100 [Paraliobacillus quinghaiensis]|uniref:M23ase beta-sheet core domain-containing protein n=1 Tax=Paraliobacillus quinghaiensis TaxID=470815 RepID=A0A917WTZ9_9BACI|nr:M23 family metallopeptidase [Paraliobacillus quinghaiensis]GGM27798.1 hypothetical protein GCM10011351_12100 [Paraliobacillus quinghaiensis]